MFPTMRTRFLQNLLVFTCISGAFLAKAQSVRIDSHPPREVIPAGDSRVIEHGSRMARKIALTFDACSTHWRTGYDTAVLQTLIDSGVPATLFLGGKWIRDHQSEARSLASSPLFEIGNHTMYHPHLPELTDSAIVNEIVTTQRIARSVTGRFPKLLRPPYGEYDGRVIRIADSLGLRVTKYDLASGDPDSSISRERLEKYVIRAAQNGSIIVMHMNGRGVHTAEALPDIISGLRQRGFRFVKVGDLNHEAMSPGRTKAGIHTPQSLQP